MNGPVAAIEISELGKRYRKTWAVRDCTFSLPRGKIAALVGPNGAGKSTLLRMLAGITAPSTGHVSILAKPPTDPRCLSRVGYLDQERPLYRELRVAEMLRFGREFNPRWDDVKAHHLLDELGIPLASKIGRLSVGQRAQVAFTMCIGKRPDVLLLDEPVAALDPLARENLMHLLLRSVVDDATTVLFSSHAVADLASFCDYVDILSESRLQLADELDNVLASHRLLIGPAERVTIVPDGVTVIASLTTGRQVTMLVCAEQPLDLSGWEERDPSLEEIVVAVSPEQPRSVVNVELNPPLGNVRTAVKGLEPR